MTKYEDLAGILIANGEAHLAMKSDCADFVRRLRTGLAASWSIPDENCVLFGVTEDLKPIINERLARKGFVLHDGFCYFCLSIKYQLPDKNLFFFSDNVMGVRKEGKRFVIQFYDKQFTVDADKLVELEPCFDTMYQEFKQAYLDARLGKKKKIGFHVRNESE